MKVYRATINSKELKAYTVLQPWRTGWRRRSTGGDRGGDYGQRVFRDDLGLCRSPSP